MAEMDPFEPNREEEDALPEVPSVPTLPEAPKLKPNLPPIKKPSDEARDYQQMGLAYSLPAALVAPILALTLGGWWLDERFHRSPTFTLGGALLGTVTGFINMFRIANRLDK